MAQVLPLFRRCVVSSSPCFTVDSHGKPTDEWTLASSVRFPFPTSHGDPSASPAKQLPLSKHTDVALDADCGWRNYKVAVIYLVFANKSASYMDFFKLLIATSGLTMGLIDYQPLSDYLFASPSQSPSVPPSSTPASGALSASLLGKHARGENVEPESLFASEAEFIKYAATREKTTTTRTTILHVRGPKPPSFLDIQEQSKILYNQIVHPSKASSGKSLSSSSAPVKKSSSSSTPSKKSKRAKTTHTSGLPIIIVPNSTNAMITLSNVKKFLTDYIYAEPTPTADSEVLIEHANAAGEKITYRVVDSTHNLKSEDWKRVVAVFASGQDWQFRDWKGKYKDPTTLFHLAKGFHVQYSDDTTPSSISSWNVQILKISRERRHLDSMVCVEVWRGVEKWVKGQE